MASLTLRLLLHTLRLLFRSRSALLLENLALRQQLAVLHSAGHRPRLSTADRMFWVALREVWGEWTKPLLIVKPATVVAWHRRGFRAYWRRISRKPGRPRISAEVRDLIRKMACENRWGAPRIHGELCKLGFDVCERTVSRYLRRYRPRGVPGTDWKTFLANHREVLAAMDFFTVPTAGFRLLYVFFVLHHDRRRIVHFNITEHPTAEWVMQQLRNAFPYDTAPGKLLMDRDSIFSAAVRAMVRTMGTDVVRSAYRSPWQNGAAERFVGTCRRELLDHVIVLNERHLHRLMREFVRYYHEDRTHLALGKDAPAKRAMTPRPSGTATVVALPKVGGLHHRYEWREAA